MNNNNDNAITVEVLSARFDEYVRINEQEKSELREQIEITKNRSLNNHLNMCERWMDMKATLSSIEIINPYTYGKRRCSVCSLWCYHTDDECMFSPNEATLIRAIMDQIPFGIRMDGYFNHLQNDGINHIIQPQPIFEVEEEEEWENFVDVDEVDMGYHTDPEDGYQPRHSTPEPLIDDNDETSSMSGYSDDEEQPTVQHQQPDQNNN